MYAVLYYMLGCAVAGAIGMAIANRKADASTSRQRWLKYFVYIIITAVVVTTIYLDYLWIVASLILLAGWYEIIKALVNSGKKRLFKIESLFIYAIIGTGFLIFSFELDYYFQLTIYLQVLMFDAFSQITGQIFGKTKLVPKISPAKTVEGAIGGFIVCNITARVVGDMLHLADISFMGVISGISALSGDLLASWFKRKMNIKDYSRLLPGQGGVLDRFDSFIATGFVYFSLIAMANLFFPLNPAL